MALICLTALSLMSSRDYTPLASSTRSAASGRSAPHDDAEGSTYTAVKSETRKSQTAAVFRIAPFRSQQVALLLPRHTLLLAANATRT